MDFHEKEWLIYQIVSGKYYIEFEEKEYIFQEPSEETLLKGIVKRRQIQKQCVLDGFFTDEEEKNMLLNERMWSPDDDKRLKQYYDDIKQFRERRKEYQFQSLKVSQLDKLIDEAKAKITDLIKVKNTFYPETVRYNTDFRYNAWLVSQCLFDNDWNRIWVSDDEFDNQSDFSMVNFFVKKLFYDGFFTEANIREIARTEPWRTRWKTATKLGVNIFNSSPAYQSKFQYILAYWSMMYDAIFENPEAPHTTIIESDEALNDWLADKQAEYDSRHKDKVDKPLITNPKIANAQEVFIAVDTPQDAEKVYKLNSPEAQKRFKARQKLIMEKGSVKEAEMPDTQLFLRMEATRAETERMKSL